MKRNSKYLNPFQAFSERESDKKDKAKEKVQYAIENNMSRAVISALSNAEHPLSAAMFLEKLAPHGSTVLCARTKALAETLRSTLPINVEFDLQSWPRVAMLEHGLQVLVIGISSSHKDFWTYSQRNVPKDPKPDAWIYVPGKMLLLFEFKNDEHPLDATQISAYMHLLGMLHKNDNVPSAIQGKHLSSAEDAQKVKDACADLVLDVTWATVVEVLKEIEMNQSIDEMGRWLCGQAANYVHWHILPQYNGTQTILDWLNGPDTPDRRSHLRRLVGQMGDALDKSALGLQSAITFAKDKKCKNGKNWDLATGAGAAVFVKLERDGKSLHRDFQGKKVGVVLWFQFSEDENQRIGLEYYIQAKGSNVSYRNGDPEAAWNKASSRHFACAKKFEMAVAELIRQTLPKSQMIVSTIRFNGKKQIWQSGIEDPNALNSHRIIPDDALSFLENNRDELWFFPRVGSGEKFSRVEDAALEVRKPALQLLATLDISKLVSCGKDGTALQNFLQKAVTSIAG